MIQLDHVSKQYRDRVDTVVDVCLSVEPGEMMVLLGPSGCGKTTTLKMINRLIEPTSGTILIDGVDTSTMDVVSLRRRIGYVFQEIGLFPHLTVAENIAIGPQLCGWMDEKTSARVNELLELVGMPAEEYAGRFPDALSGGQRQRVGFARALATYPKVMLMDEPFGALDPITRDSMQKEFKLLQKKLGLTVLMVTHDIVEAITMGDRIAVMAQGRVVQVSSPSGLYLDPEDNYVAELITTPVRHLSVLNSIFTQTQRAAS